MDCLVVPTLRTVASLTGVRRGPCLGPLERYRGVRNETLTPETPRRLVVLLFTYKVSPSFLSTYLPEPSTLSSPSTGPGRVLREELRTYPKMVNFHWFWVYILVRYLLFRDRFDITLNVILRTEWWILQTLEMVRDIERLGDKGVDRSRYSIGTDLFHYRYPFQTLSGEYDVFCLTLTITSRHSSIYIL